MRRKATPKGALRAQEEAENARAGRFKAIGFAVGATICIVAVVWLFWAMGPPSEQAREIAVRLEMSATTDGFTYTLEHVTTISADEWPFNHSLPGYAWLGYLKRVSDGAHYNCQYQRWQPELWRMERLIGGSGTTTGAWQASIIKGTQVYFYMVLSSITGERIKEVRVVGTIE